MAHKSHAALDRHAASEGYLGLITVATFLLVGSVAALVATTADFERPQVLWERGPLHLLTSGWGQLVADFLLFLLLMFSNRRLSGLSLRRIEFCILLSVLSHLWLLWTAAQLDVPGVANVAASAPLPTPANAREDRPAEFAFPDHRRQDVDSPDGFREPFEQPLDVRPDQPAEATRLAPKPMDHEPLEPRTPAEIERAEEKPEPTPLERAELPRRDEMLPGPQIARHEVEHPGLPSEPIDAPKAAEAVPNLSGRLDSQHAGADRQATGMPGELRPQGSAEADLPGSGSGGGGPGPAMNRRVESGGSGALGSAGSPAELARQPNGSAPSLDAPPIEELPARSPSDENWNVLAVRSASTDLERDAAIYQPSSRAAISGPNREVGYGGGLLPAVTRNPRDRRVSEGPTAAPGGSGAGGSGSEGVGMAASGIEAGAGTGGLTRSTARPDLPGTALEEAPVAGAIGSAGPGSGRPGSGGGRSSGSGSAGAPQLEASSRTALTRPGDGAGLNLRIDAPRGTGGLSPVPSDSMGIPSRRALPEATTVARSVPRISIAKSGGPPSIEGATGEDPKSFFRQRDPARRGEIGRQFGATEGTDRAVELGIHFLVRHQFPDGHWSFDRLPQGKAPGYEDAGLGQMNADTAATGLALLAMLGAGYTHQDEKHQAEVARGLQWLLKNQQDDGRLSSPATDSTRYGMAYGHAIATIAVCEAYGMTGDPQLRDPAQRAIDYIIAAQHPDRGGWRYEPRRESDTSVSGWQLMALKSAQIARLKVPAETVRKVSHWLDLAQDRGGSRYRYNPYAADNDEQRAGRLPNLAMTAEGLLMRMYLGASRNTPGIVEGQKYLMANLPEFGTPTQPRRDAYYWYYATQVMFQMQGEGWEAWNGRMRELLPASQVLEGPLAGSWNPLEPVADRWGQAAGRHYVTAIHLLMLEVYWRHLPLYKPL
jgi:hypothetical protein